MDKKDEIILQQLEVIRAMTENNLRSMSGDFWGSTPSVPSAKEEESPSDKLLSILKEEDPKAELTPQKKEAAKVETKAKPEEPEETLEDLKKELEGYVGLETVKEEVKGPYQFGGNLSKAPGEPTSHRGYVLSYGIFGESRYRKDHDRPFDGESV